ncbi:Hypothetical protein R9X50_00801100 [Acrodontium crateriforme]|uniref:Carbohydrate-binding-like protein n=1 Tax=Acrodontium crateriforme TaxID=150365 RepID=A0AAQ3MC62_9PEZI|nr:Hypothetical protein R9X50_00801100 [Acrodontium crateriforme]
MQYYALAALLAGAIASPLPQDLDWAAIDSLEPVPSADIPVVNAAAAASTVSYAPAQAATSVAAAVQADPTDVTPKVKRDNSACATTPTSDDTDSAFTSNGDFSTAANGASAPAGYVQVYQNQAGSSQGIYGYMGYSVLPTYDVQQCSENCDAVLGCQSFNIYFERDPSVDPTSSCSNPPSETVIKCVYYGGPITSDSATNVGQWRDDFHVVIAGSNAYVNHSITEPDGYSGAVFLGNSAINAPLDCNGHDTYMGVKLFDSAPFDANLCATACSAQSDYNRAHPDSDGYFQTCQFFNTYVLYENNVAVGQYCSLYNETWAPSYATNDGQYRGDDHYTIGYSYSFSNSTGGADEPTSCS